MTSESKLSNHLTDIGAHSSNSERHKELHSSDAPSLNGVASVNEELQEQTDFLNDEKSLIERTIFNMQPGEDVSSLVKYLECLLPNEEVSDKPEA